MTKIIQHTQKQRVFLYLQKHIATGSMVSEATGVPHKNFCRYKSDMQQQGLLAEVKKAHCELTGFPAYYLTCNPDLFPKKNQLNMFNDGK